LFGPFLVWLDAILPRSVAVGCHRHAVLSVYGAEDLRQGVRPEMCGYDGPQHIHIPTARLYAAIRNAFRGTVYTGKRLVAIPDLPLRQKWLDALRHGGSPTVTLPP
jgi:hypothetical protein